MTIYMAVLPYLVLLNNPYFLFVFGLCVGSFLNVVVYRLPLMDEKNWRAAAKELTEPTSPTDADSGDTPFNLSTPKSHCPQCGHAIRWYENIPVLSWFFLKGKCSACKTPISIKYPVTELFCGLAYVALYYRFEGSVLALGWCAVFSYLFVAAQIDKTHMYLPDSLVYPVLWLGLIVNALGLNLLPNYALWGGIVGYFALWPLDLLMSKILGQKAVGDGDFKLLAAIGAWVGPTLIPVVLFFSFFIFIAIWLMSNKGIKNIDNPQPFGPAIVISAFLIVLNNPQSLLNLLPF